MAGRISIRDLARIASVSRTTVSLALRDSHKISAPLRKHIQELAIQHNYRSHPMLTSLMQQVRLKKKIQDEEIIGFITSGLTENEWKDWPWNREIWEGAAFEAHNLGFRLEPFWAGYRAKNSRHLSQVLYHRGIRSIFFAPMPWPHFTFYMPWQKFTTVACTPSTGIKELPVVKSNHQYGVHLVLSKLKELGAKSIGIVLSEEDDLRVERNWSAGIHIFSLDYPKTKIHVLRVSGYENPRELASWLKKTRLDVLLGVREELPSLLVKLGRQPGRDIAYASLNVEKEALGKTAGLYQNPSYLGQRAVQYLSRAIYNQTFGLPAHAESIVVEGRFIEGSSLAPLLKLARPVLA